MTQATIRTILRQATPTSRRGFTIIECAALLASCAVGAALVGVAQPRVRAAAINSKDLAQMRGNHQAMIIFAGHNKDRYPLPSQLDLQGKTVDVGQAEDPSLAPLADSTRNIFSILIYQGFVPLEALISPAEVSEHIALFKDYQFDEPRAARDPIRAIWDPGFRATPKDAGVVSDRAGMPGGFSYAHAIPLGGRAAAWGSTFDSTHAVISNRGPSYILDGAADTGVWRLVDDGGALDPTFSTPMGAASTTLLIHGPADAWNGGVVMGDNAAHWHAEPDPTALLFTFGGVAPAGPFQRPDNLFVREHDDSRLASEDNLRAQQTFGQAGESVRNNYLRSYAGGPGRIIAGGTPEARTWVLDIFLD